MDKDGCPYGYYEDYIEEIVPGCPTVKNKKINRWFKSVEDYESQLLEEQRNYHNQKCYTEEFNVRI